MLTTKIGIGQSHGKIILIGDHAVVYGYPAIAIPFPATTIQTTVTGALDPEHAVLECSLYNGVMAEMPELLYSLKKTIEVTLAKLNQATATLDIKITSSIPAERGMGSSAAVAVATIRALYSFFDQPLVQEELLALVEISEKIAHGNPSGLDAYTISTSSLCYFQKAEPIQAIAPVIDGVLIVADTGLTGKTKEAVADVRRATLQPATGAATTALLGQLGALTKATRICLETNQLAELGRLLTEAHRYLVALNVSSPELNHLVAVAEEHGALGAKLTGGGRGGCMIALAENEESAQKIEVALQAAGAKQTWSYEMRNLSL